MLNQNLLLAGDDAYNLTKSLRFRSSVSAYLNRTPASAGNRQKFTFSVWIKRGLLSSGSNYRIFQATDTSSGAYEGFEFAGDTFTVRYHNGSFVTVQTSAVLRDPSAWYHLVGAIDTTDATSSNRIKLYINGVQQTTTGTQPAQNYSFPINDAVPQAIASYPTGGEYFDGYMAEVNLVDGQALTPSSFGSTNALTGVWQPAKYTGTYGTNGFYLPFTNTTSTSTLGNDFSGNSNTWTVNNISLTTGSTYDSMNDVPTLTSATAANYAVLNPLSTLGGASTTNGNLNGTTNTTNGAVIYSTIQIPDTGKWYWELTPTSGGNEGFVGIESQVFSTASSATYKVIYYANTGNKYVDATSSAYGATWTDNDVIAVAVNADSGTVTFYKNNTSQGAITYSVATKNMFVSFRDGAGASSMVFNVNFGQQPFTYTPPTGFVALNTFNLPTSTIVNGGKCMDATIYTGDGSQTKSFTNTFGFKPDLVWSKIRSGTTQGTGVFDSVRGTTGQSLDTASTSAEGTWNGALSSEYGYVSAFNSNGFSVDDGSVATTGGYVNYSGRTYVAWQWQAGQGSTSSNTSGSITSTVSVNATAGFSVVTYTGTGSNATVGHGLGVAPSMYIVKSRSNGGTYYDWAVYHTGLGGNTKTMWLNLTNTVGTYPSYWNSTSPTSSVFSLGNDITVNQSSATYVAYCWSEIAGFSKFGSYTGNGSSDGPFVYLGFRPRFIMFQCTTAGSNWTIVDTARSPYNAATLTLLPNDSRAEVSYANYDFLSNGFKIRGSLTNEYNVSGQTYIYAAFAENPLKYSLAR